MWESPLDRWANFAVIMGGAAAALVGLLFVAVSIRADVLSQSKGLRSRISQILVIFLGLLGASICLSVPNPTALILGIELIAVALSTGAAFIVLNHCAEGGGEREGLETTLNRLNPNVTTSVLIGLAGIALVFGATAGLFLLALAALAGFVGGVVGAWLVLVRPKG